MATTSTISTSSERVFTIADVAEHNTKDDLWIIIRGKVYDVTAFKDEHPGGDRVLIKLAGKDATENFDNVGHSDTAKDLMKKFQVGVIGSDDAAATTKKILPGGLTEAEFAALPIKTIAEVSTKDGSSDGDNKGELWIIIRNLVYDVTNFWKMHPGGPKAIKDLAGKDATVEFEKVGHTTNAMFLLKKYLHARLSDEEAKDWSKMQGQQMKQFTLKEVETHKKDGDAWLIIDNRVYDVSEFLGSHPGGREPLLYHAGLDGTDAFAEVGHSLNAKNKMKGMQIGVIVEAERRTAKPATCQSTSYSDVTAETLRSVKTHTEGGKFPLVTTIMILALLLFSLGGVGLMIAADRSRSAAEEL